MSKNKHCVVYGGTAALAKPLIESWLQRGHQVTAVCRNLEKAKDRLPREATCVSPDDYLREDYLAGGFVDLLVTLTGSVANARLKKMEYLHWKRVIEDCLSSVWRALRDTIPRMVKGSHVVVVGSIVASTGGFGCCNYAAAKAGLAGLVRAAANEHAENPLYINLLELGYTNLGMGSNLPVGTALKAKQGIPLQRFAETEDFLLAVDFLSQTKYMTGNVLTLAGGMQ